MRTKGFPVFRLFPDDRIIAQGQTMIPSSGNNLNLNTGNLFVRIPKQLPNQIPTMTFYCNRMI
jgi:hypothetical protein